MSASTIQTIIDENKEDMPDGVYLKLCNEMKKLHTKTNKGIYTLTLIKINKYHNNGINHYDCDWESKKKFVRMPETSYEKIKECIEQDGWYGLNTTNNIEYECRDLLNEFNSNVEMAVISKEDEEYMKQDIECDVYDPYKTCSITFQEYCVVKISEI